MCLSLTHRYHTRDSRQLVLCISIITNSFLETRLGQTCYFEVIFFNFCNLPFVLISFTSYFPFCRRSFLFLLVVYLSYAFSVFFLFSSLLILFSLSHSSLYFVVLCFFSLSVASFNLLPHSLLLFL